jgi:hypothetical protein
MFILRDSDAETDQRPLRLSCEQTSDTNRSHIFCRTRGVHQSIKKYREWIWRPWESIHRDQSLWAYHSHASTQPTTEEYSHILASMYEIQFHVARTDFNTSVWTTLTTGSDLTRTMTSSTITTTDNLKYVPKTLRLKPLPGRLYTVISQACDTMIKMTEQQDE